MLGEIVAVGVGRTFTVMEVESAQEPECTTTEYVLVEVGVTVITAEVCPVLHENVEPPEAVSVALWPEHKFEFPVMEAAMEFETVTVAVAVPEQLPLDTSTE